MVSIKEFTSCGCRPTNDGSTNDPQYFGFGERVGEQQTRGEDQLVKITPRLAACSTLITFLCYFSVLLRSMTVAILAQGL